MDAHSGVRGMAALSCDCPSGGAEAAAAALAGFAPLRATSCAEAAPGEVGMEALFVARSGDTTADLPGGTLARAGFCASLTSGAGKLFTLPWKARTCSARVVGKRVIGQVPLLSNKETRPIVEHRRCRFSSIALRAPCLNQWFPMSLRFAPFSRATLNVFELFAANSAATCSASAFWQNVRTFFNSGKSLLLASAAFTKAL
mmetsp:Transcript_120962/g.342211  ORF Transcript_120962/g.342211 Transcript_120962/m.342211 type:complete len:201 (+) Transcript_120962:280-882(+)